MTNRVCYVCIPAIFFFIIVFLGDMSSAESSCDEFSGKENSVMSGSESGSEWEEDVSVSRVTPNNKKRVLSSSSTHNSPKKSKLSTVHHDADTDALWCEIRALRRKVEDLEKENKKLKRGNKGLAGGGGTSSSMPVTKAEKDKTLALIARTMKSMMAYKRQGKYGGGRLRSECIVRPALAAALFPKKKYTSGEFEALIGTSLSKSIRYDYLVCYGNVNIRYTASEQKLLCTGTYGISKFVDKE